MSTIYVDATLWDALNPADQQAAFDAAAIPVALA